MTRIDRANQRVSEANARLAGGDYSPAAMLAMAEASAEQRCAYAAPRAVCVATGRNETDACERNTVGCCIDHTASDPGSECETW